MYKDQWNIKINKKKENVGNKEKKKVQKWIKGMIYNGNKRNKSRQKNIQKGLK